MGGEVPFNGFLLRGKFTDDSTPEDWHCMIDRANVDLIPYVDPVTKEFEYRQKTKPIYLNNLFQRGKIEGIHEMRGTESVVDLSSAFQMSSLTFADLSGVDTSNCLNLGSLFTQSYISDISSIANWDTGKNKTMSAAFRGIPATDLTPLANWDVSSVETFWYTFQAGPNERIIRFNDWDVRSCTSFLNWFGDGNRNIVVEGTIKNILSDIGFTASLSNASAMVFINGLAQVEEPQTISFSKATFATLTPEQIAIAESKNWIVAQL